MKPERTEKEIRISCKKMEGNISVTEYQDEEVSHEELEIVHSNK